MKKFTSSILIALLFFLVVDCKKDDAIAAITGGGCSFTFKGTSYSLSIVTCAQSATQLTGTSSDAKQVLVMYKGGAIGTLITFTPDNSKSVIYDNGPTPPSISISGNTWTFSGTLVDDLTGDSGTISGKCTCSN